MVYTCVGMSCIGWDSRFKFSKNSSVEFRETTRPNYFFHDGLYDCKLLDTNTLLTCSLLGKLQWWDIKQRKVLHTMHTVSDQVRKL
jgi:hypothetical protein